VAALAVGGVLLLAMIGASWWGAAGLAAGARVPIHLGSADRAYWAPKWVGLVAWPTAGALCYGVLGGISASGVAADWVPGVRDVLVPAVMVVLLGFQVGALMLARRGPASGADAGLAGAGDGADAGLAGAGGGADSGRGGSAEGNDADPPGLRGGEPAGG
jgi:hypothetical protein